MPIANVAAGLIPDGTPIVGAVVNRREPYAPPDMTPASRNVRPVEIVFPHEAPEAPRQGDTPSRPARMPIAVFQSVASILAVQQDEMVAPLWAPVHLASTSYRLGVNPQAVGKWSEKANLQQARSAPYGSGHEIVSNHDLLMGRA